MRAEEALEKMTELANALSESFAGSGVNADVQPGLLDRKMDAADSISKAKYIDVSIVLSAEESGEDEEYCLTLGAEIFRGTVSESLYRDMNEFTELVTKTAERLKGSENKAAVIKALIKEAEGELDGVIADIKKRRRKAIITALIGVLAIGAVIGLGVFITLSAGA